MKFIDLENGAMQVTSDNGKQIGFIDRSPTNGEYLFIPNNEDGCYNYFLMYQIANKLLSLNESEQESDQPYIKKHRSETDRFYNKNYGDDRVCECGHTYYRHFDSHENMEDCGCKYCGCNDFKEAETGR